MDADAPGFLRVSKREAVHVGGMVPSGDVEMCVSPTFVVVVIIEEMRHKQKRKRRTGHKGA